jgi:hypothetical protein
MHKVYEVDGMGNGEWGMGKCAHRSITLDRDALSLSASPLYPHLRSLRRATDSKISLEGAGLSPPPSHASKERAEIGQSKAERLAFLPTGSVELAPEMHGLTGGRRPIISLPTMIAAAQKSHWTDSQRSDERGEKWRVAGQSMQRTQHSERPPAPSKRRQRGSTIRYLTAHIRRHHLPA